MEVTQAGNEHVTLGAAAASHLSPVTAVSRDAIRSERLLSEHVWSSRTERTRDSQWKTYLAFCNCDGWDPLPVTVAYFVAFIGWLAEEREVGRHRISNSSVT